MAERAKTLIMTRIEHLAKMPLRRKIELGIMALLIFVVMALPFYSGTRTYPVAIVAGNSMYPALQNGDLVLFKAVDPQTMANGTIIVYVQSNTAISALDTLLKPIIVHRVVGSFVQADGTLYYLTKGDNNEFNDPSAVKADNVLGVPVQVVPKVGLVLLFLSSPQGLVALIGFITLFYLSYYEAKLNEDRTKEAFLETLAQMVVDGALPEEVFRRFEIAVKYVHDVESEEVKDRITQALGTWLKRLAVEKGWIVRETTCPNCASDVNRFEVSENLRFMLCPRCIWQKQTVNKVETQVATTA